MKRALRIGVIGGLGRVASLDIKSLQYYEWLHPGRIQIEQICSREEEKVKERYNIQCKVEKDYQAITTNKDIDIIINCASTDLHYKINESALLNNKHLYTHKPAAQTLSQIHHLYQISNNNPSIKTAVCFQRRYANNYNHLKQKVSTDQLGNIETIQLISRDKIPPSVDFLKSNDIGREGIIQDFGVHDFDLVRYLTGLEFKSVFVQSDNLFMKESKNSSDTAMIMFRLTNGAIGNIVLGRRNSYGYDQRIEIFGSKTLARVNHNNSDNMIESWDKYGLHKDQGKQEFMSYYKDEFGLSIHDFIDSIINDSVHKSTLEDAYQAFRVIAAASLSLKENRHVQLYEIDQKTNIIHN